MTDQALPIDPESPSIAEDIRRKIQEKAAVKRGTDWERMACPTSELHMPVERYNRDYRGRIWCANKSVFEQMQQALKLVFCPKCIKEETYGAIEGTRFYITVEDDLMTVFPAVVHFVCHNCGFEEWHPLKYDPRKQAETQQESATAIRMRQQQAMLNIGQQIGSQAGIGIGNALMGGLSDYQAALQNQLGQKVAEGIDRGMGPIYGMTDEEQRALYRLYQQQQKGATAPPPIVSSREEAETLLKMAPVERRQSIIQKLRDLGKI